MALSLAFLGPFLGLCGGAVVLHRWPCPWPPVGLSGPFLRFLGCWLAPAAAAGLAVGFWWPLVASSGLSFGLCGVRLVWPVWASPGLSSAFSGPFLRLFWGWLLVSLWGVLPWSSLGSCWCPVRSPGLVLLGSGSKVVEDAGTTLSSCRWYGLCRGGARRVEDGLGKGSILSTHILPL